MSQTLTNSCRRFSKNWPLFLSGAAYLVTAFFITKSVAYPGGPWLSLFSAFLGILVILFFCFRADVLTRALGCSRRPLRIVSAASAAGICFELYHIYRSSFPDLGKETLLRKILQEGLGFSSLPAYAQIENALIAILCVLSFLFIYAAVNVFFYKLIQIFKETDIFSGVSKTEIFVYAGIALAAILFMTVAYNLSKVFYASGDFDAIYSFDSSYIFQEDAYIHLGQQENDLRQPLFAVFCAPFMGIPALISNVFALSVTWKAILFNAVQIVMLLAGNFFLAKALCRSSGSRIAFFLLLSATYPSLLFMLAMEQYVTAYFWLCLAVYCAGQNASDDFVLWGTAGTLLTSAIMIPINKCNLNRRKFFAWVWDCIKCGLGFLLLLVVFGRANIIIDSLHSALTLMRFCGPYVPFMDRFIRFAEFVENCFFPTSTFVATEPVISWSLTFPDTVNYVGVAILVLAAISLILNRKNKICVISGIWVLFSAAILLVMGLGYAYNCFILYGLYFSWCYFILIHQLVVCVAEKLKVQKVLPVLAVIAGILLFCMNLNAIVDMIRYGIQYYPI